MQIDLYLTFTNRSLWLYESLELPVVILTLNIIIQTRQNHFLLQSYKHW